MLELPRPDNVIFLHLPYEYSLELKSAWSEPLDEVEKNAEYLKNGEKAYLELAEMYNFQTIECVQDGKIKSIEEIGEEIYSKIEKI